MTEPLGHGEWPDVLAAAQTGAPWALSRIFETFQGQVRGYAAGRGCDDPDEVASDAFLGAFRGIAGFEGDLDAFRSWLFTIVHRRVIDARRRASRRPATTTFDPRRHDQPTSPEPAMGDDTGLGDLAPVLDELRARERDVLLLRVVAGLSASEVAAVLGLREGHVRVLQHRALNALRRAMNADV